MLFIDLTSSNADGKDILVVIYENINVFEDIPLFTGEDSNLENGFPTFYILSVKFTVNECLSLWTGDAEDFMYEINFEMNFTEELNRSVI